MFWGIRCAAGGQAKEKPRHTHSVDDGVLYFEENRLRGFADGFFDDILVIFNFDHRFKADDDGIDAAEVEDEVGALLTQLAVIAIFALADEFHADDAFAGIVNFADDGDNLIGRAIHL